MCISIDGTTPLVDSYREIDVTLLLLKVYNRVPKCAHVIILYKTKLITVEHIPEITHWGKPTPVHALRHHLFLSVRVAQLIRRVLTSIYFAFVFNSLCGVRDETIKTSVQRSKTKICRQTFPLQVKGTSYYI